MATLCTIIKKIYNKNTNNTNNEKDYFFDPQKKINMFELISTLNNELKKDENVSYNFDILLMNITFEQLISKIITHTDNFQENDQKKLIKEKYIFFNFICKNQFYSEKQKELFISLFQKIQKIYFAFSKLAFLYKFKRAKIQINTDLFMNDLNENMNNVFTLFQNKCKYLFSLSDLINIFNSNLSKNSVFFPDPSIPKNPYNNILFDNACLYNIYFFMKSKNIIIPQLFQQFFISNFDLDEFVYNNECILRDFSIKSFVYSTSYNILYPIIMSMIDFLIFKNPRLQVLSIHKDFPKEKMVEIMKPYLHLYYLSEYYIDGTDKKSSSYLKLKKKFELFVRFNPCFGRKIIKSEIVFNSIKNVFTRVNVVSFNYKHMEFNKKYEDRSKFRILDDIIDYDNFNFVLNRPFPYVNREINLLNIRQSRRLLSDDSDTESESEEESLEEEEEEEEDE